MRKDTAEWSVRMLADFESRITVDDEFQRGAVWSTAQQALLIDSILRGFDIPKIFLRKLPDGSPRLFSVIDGKQRLTAIWSFLRDGFPLLRKVDSFPVFGNLGGKRWSELPDDAKDKLQFANLTVSRIEDATVDEVRELFLRLQKGAPLNAAETRNAAAGPVRDFVANTLATHPVWGYTGIRQARFGWHEHSAIVLALIRQGGPTGLKGADLQRLYDMEDFDAAGPDAGRAIEVLDALRHVAECGRGRIRTRWGVVDLTLILMRLRNDGVTVEPADVMAFFESFEEERRRVGEVVGDLQTQVVEFSAETDLPPDDVEWAKIPADMLQYYMAFAREGANRENVETRSNVMYRRFVDFLETK